MKFAFVSPNGLSLAWWLQLLEEGHEVRVWISGEQYQRIGDGLVDKADDVDQLTAWGGKDALYVFDYTTKGHLSRQLRDSGYLVFGADPILDKLEKDRGWAMNVATMLGIKVPRKEEFKTLTDAVAWVKRRPADEQWFFKPSADVENAATFGAKDVEDMVRQLEYFQRRFGNSLPGILQEKINGVVIDTCAWWDGSKFIEPFIGMLEYKKFMPGEVGPNTGCEICWVWGYEKYPRIAKELRFDQLAELFRRVGVPPGEYGINSVVNENDKKPYLIEWDPRMGYDEDVAYLVGLTEELGGSVMALARGTLSRTPLVTEQTVLGVRLSVPPYPWEHVRDDKSSCVGVPVQAPKNGSYYLSGVMKNEGGLALGDAFGLVGVATEVGTNITTMRRDVYKTISEFRVPNLQYRDDAGEHRERDDIRRLKGWGFETPPLKE